MNDIRWFPINFEKVRGIPINNHPGAFGCARKYNFHEGIDLYGKPGDFVYAIRRGTIIDIKPFTGPQAGYDWWLDTSAILVQDEDGYYVYGELTTTKKIGDVVTSGDKIGELTPVLPESKLRLDIPEHSVTMLHLERYNMKYKPEMGWASWDKRENRPIYLEDPTVELVNILTKKKRSVKFLTV